VAGTALRGWLIDTARPARRIRFNLLIDEEFRGTFTANRRRASVVRKKSETAEDTHGFLIPIRHAWISGKPQAVRLEGASDRGLDLSMTAKLGPAPNQNFEEHVVSGHAVLGARERVPLAAEDHPDDSGRRGLRLSDPTKPLLKKIAALSDSDLASLVVAIERDVLHDRFVRYDQAGDAQSAWAFRRVFLGGAFEELLTVFGRSAMKGHGGAGQRILTAAAALFPQSFEANHQAGMANAQQGDFEEALRLFLAADSAEEGGSRAKQELVNLLGRMLRVPMRPERSAELRAQHLELLTGLSTSDNAGLRARYRVQLAAALYHAGRYDEAAAAADAILATAPNDVKALIVRARALVARNDVAEARAAYERVLELDRDNAVAQLGMRTLSGLVASQASAAGELASRPAADGWICVGKPGAVSEEHLEMLRDAPQRGRGFVRIAATNGTKLDFWRADVLADLQESGLIPNQNDVQALSRWKSAYGVRRPAASSNAAAVVFRADDADERHGAQLKGFAKHYAREGFEPILVGVGGDGGIRVPEGLRMVTIPRTAAAIRRVLLESDACLVHALSGVVTDVARAVRFTNMSFICGIGVPSQEFATGEPEDGGDISLELRCALERADAVYANSRLAQRAIEQTFGVRCAIVFDVPLD
jgi:tetratricopeptide (TPR) repeat protein